MITSVDAPSVCFRDFCVWKRALYAPWESHTNISTIVWINMKISGQMIHMIPSGIEPAGIFAIWTTPSNTPCCFKVHLGVMSVNSQPAHCIGRVKGRAWALENSYRRSIRLLSQLVKIVQNIQSSKTMGITLFWNHIRNNHWTQNIQGKWMSLHQTAARTNRWNSIFQDKHKPTV